MSGWRHALSWFPGHVARATKVMQERIRKVDIVIEVRDARAPRSSGSMQLSKLISSAGRNQEHFIVVNKADLVSKGQREAIKRWLLADHPGVPMYFTSARSAQGAVKGIDELLAAAVLRVRNSSPRLFAGEEEYGHRGAAPSSQRPSSDVARAISDAASRAAGVGVVGMPAARSLPLIMMVVGVPNVGKSSLINAFRRVGVERAEPAHQRSHASRSMRLRTRKPARTGALPGVTTALSGFQVCWRPHVWMLDTPGVLSPSVDGGWEAALRLGVLDLIKYRHDSLEAVAAYALYHLAIEDASSLERWPSAANLVAAADEQQLLSQTGAVGVPAAHFTDTADDGAPCDQERFALRLLDAVAKDMGLWVRGGRLSARAWPNAKEAAQRVLRMMRRGELGPVCFDMRPPQLDSMHRGSRDRPKRAVRSAV